MNLEIPASWAELKQPQVRRELLLILDELTSEDPCQVWADERRQGLIAGFDEVIHFFFDDHDFDAGYVGISLLDEAEVGLIERVKRPLGAICDDLPHGEDVQSATHPLWQEVRQSSVRALTAMRGR